MNSLKRRKMFLLCSHNKHGDTTLGCMATNFRCVSFLGAGFTQAARVKPCPSESIRRQSRDWLRFAGESWLCGLKVWRIATP